MRSQLPVAASPGGEGSPAFPDPPLSPPPNLHMFPQARDCKMLGDVEGARRHSTRAKVLNIICSLLMVVTVVVAIVGLVALIT